ncbi:hypothetical protein [Martelella sp. HB161492]|uniref:hypothetical protein n=1 Tax=Martelella sp. HB161492 TaxID=2720726 RepID=UPI00159132DA|nr:hypothetical protein [Martelella sp. HB161492]
MSIADVKNKSVETTVHARARKASVPEPSTPSPAAQLKEELVARRDTFAGSFSAMLSEAYDGDTAEQMHLLSHGVEGHGDHGSEAVESTEVSESEERPRAQKSGYLERSEEALLNGLRRKKEVQSAEKAAPTDLQQVPERSLVAAHERLMLASTQMQISEVGTHVSVKAFSRLTNILASPSWMRDPHFTEAPLKAHAA